MSNVLQATDLTFKIPIKVYGTVPESLTHIKYELYNKSGTAVEKTLASPGVMYLEGVLTIPLTDTETLPLVGQYYHACMARTVDGVDFMPLEEKPITFVRTKPRIGA